MNFKFYIGLRCLSDVVKIDILQIIRRKKTFHVDANNIRRTTKVIVQRY